MKAKKIISVLMTVLFVLTMTTTGFAGAPAVTYLVSDALTADVNSTVAIPLQITSTIATEGVGCILTYDKSLLTYVDFEDTGSIGASNIEIVNDATAGTIKVVIIKAVSEYSGTAFTFNFTTAAAVTGNSQDAAINVAFADETCVNADLDPIDVSDMSFVSGKVTIGTPAPAIPNITAVTSPATKFVAADETYAAVVATLPTTVSATLSDETTKDVAVVWNTEGTLAAAGEYTTITGTIAATDTYTNNDSKTVEAKVYTVSDAVAVTVDGYSMGCVLSKVGSPATVAATYAAGLADFATYAFVVTDAAETAVAPTEASAWSATPTYTFDAEGTLEHGAYKKVTTFVKVNGGVVASAESFILKDNKIAKGSIYINATATNPTFSALRVNKAAGMTVTKDFSYINEADHDFANGAFTYGIYAYGGAGDAIVENANGIFSAADIADLNGAYTVKVKYVEEGFDTIEVSRTANISNLGLWYSAFSVNNKNGVAIVKKSATNTMSFTLDAFDGADKLYTGLEVADYGIAASADVALTETANLESSYAVDVASKAKGAYTLYALAKKTNDQSYYDFAFGKTIYVEDSLTSVCNVNINGSVYCAANGAEEIAFQAYWGGNKFESNVSYKYTFYKWDGEAYVPVQVNGADYLTSGDDNAAVTVNDAQATFAFANKVVVEVSVNGELDKTVEKIFYK